MYIIYIKNIYFQIFLPCCLLASLVNCVQEYHQYEDAQTLKIKNIEIDSNNDGTHLEHEDIEYYVSIFLLLIYYYCENFFGG